MKKCYENPWKLRNPSRNRMFVMEKGYRMLVYWSVYDIYHGLSIWFVLNVMMKCSGHTSDKGGFHTHFAQQSRAKCSEGTHFEGFLEQANFPLRKSAEDIGFMVHFSLYSILDFCGLIRQWFLFQIISEDWRMGSGCLCGSDFSDLLIADGKQHGGKNARCVKVFHFRKPGSSVGLESHFFNMTLQEYNISIWIDLEENCPTFFLGVHFLSRKSACRRCVFFWVKCRYPFFRGVWTPRSSTCSGRTRQVSEPWMESCENSCFFWEVLGSAGKHFPKCGNEMFVEQ